MFEDTLITQEMIGIQCRKKIQKVALNKYLKRYKKTLRVIILAFFPLFQNMGKIGGANDR